MFITVFLRPGSGPYSEPDQSIPPHRPTISVESNLMISSRLRLDLEDKVRAPGCLQLAGRYRTFASSPKRRRQLPLCMPVVRQWRREGTEGEPKATRFKFMEFQASPQVDPL